MSKIWNRIRYGASNIPKYITKQHRWLYKGKWVSVLEAISYYTNEVSIADEQKIAYMYRLNGKLGYKYDFNEFLALMIANPNVCVADYFQFTPIQLELVKAVQKAHYHNILNNYQNEYAKIQHEMQNLFK